MKNRLNLLYLNYSFDIGGIETLILNTAKALDKNRYNITICSLQGKNYLEAEFRRIGVDFVKIPKKRGIDISLIFKIRNLYKKRNIQVTHTHNAEQLLYGVLAAFLMRRPKIIHTQHSALESNKTLLVSCLKFLSRKTFKMISVAQYVEDYMIKKGHIEKEKIQIIYNGIEYDKYNTSASKEEKRKELEILKQSEVIGIVARLVPVKDHKSLLNAFAIVTRRVSNAVLLIIGDGELSEYLKKYAEELKIRENIKFLGNRRDIPELLRALDLFVLASISEGLSMTLLEAMAGGLPVVATDVGGNREIVKNGETGILVPSRNPEKLADAICVLLGDKKKAIEYGRNGLQRCKQIFDFNNMVSEYMKLYESSLTR